MIRLPEQFAARMKSMLGEKEFSCFLSSYDAPRRQALRFNPLKMPDDFLQNNAASLESFHLRPVPWAAPFGYYYTEGGTDTERPGKSPLHEAGLYYIQEPSAMAVAALSGTKPGEKILDLCAAPGGKSSQIAGMLQGEGLLISNEINPERAKILSQNMERMGVRNAIVTCEESGTLAERFGALFDRVIVDAPCSGEGMFRKEEQALSMWSPANVTRCAARQREILSHAALMVKTGGILEYSTCTFAPEEDEETVAAFLSEHPDFSLADLPEQIGQDQMVTWGFDTGKPEWCRSKIPSDSTTIQVDSETRNQLAKTIRLWPHRLEGEGHFIAVLRRGREDSSVKSVIPSGTGLKTEPSAAVRIFLSSRLSSDPAGELAETAGSSSIRFGDRICLVPCASQISLKGLHIDRPGLELGILKKDRFEPSHSLAMALRPSEVHQCHDVDALSRDASAWLHGESIPCDSSLKGWTLVTVDGVSVGWGKASGGILKNHYPKGLRRPY